MITNFSKQGGRRYGLGGSTIQTGVTWMRTLGATVTLIVPQDLVAFLLTIVRTKTGTGFRILRSVAFAENITRSRAFGEER